MIVFSIKLLWLKDYISRSDRYTINLPAKSGQLLGNIHFWFIKPTKLIHFFASKTLDIRWLEVIKCPVHQGSVLLTCIKAYGWLHCTDPLYNDQTRDRLDSLVLRLLFPINYTYFYAHVFTNYCHVTLSYMRGECNMVLSANIVLSHLEHFLFHSYYICINLTIHKIHFFNGCLTLKTTCALPSSYTNELFLETIKTMLHMCIIQKKKEDTTLH